MARNLLIKVSKDGIEFETEKTYFTWDEYLECSREWTVAGSTKIVGSWKWGESPEKIVELLKEHLLLKAVLWKYRGTHINIKIDYQNPLCLEVDDETL